MHKDALWQRPCLCPLLSAWHEFFWSAEFLTQGKVTKGNVDESDQLSAARAHHVPRASRSLQVPGMLSLPNIPAVQGNGDQHHPASVTAVQSCTPAFKPVKQSHPDLGGEGGYMNFSGQKQAPSASISSDPSDAGLRSSWITLWRFPFLLVRHKRSKAPVVTSSSINVWFLDALSWSRNISPLVGKVVEKRWVAAVAFLGNVRYYMTC